MMYKLLCKYGLSFVSPHNISVSTINGIGVVTEIVYVHHGHTKVGQA